MIIREITEQNIEGFIDPVPAEFVNEIRRECVKGLSGEDEKNKLKAAVIFELRTGEEDTPAEAEIVWFFASDPSSGEEVLRALPLSPESGGIGRIFFEMKELSPAEEEAFSLAGFSLKRKESRDVLVSVRDLASLSLSKKTPPEYVKPLSEITSRQFKAAVMSSVFHGRYGLLEDLPFLPITRFDPDISCSVLTDDRVNALLLVSGRGTEGFRVELLFALQPDANIHLLNMITYAIRAAVDLGQPGDRVLLRRHNEVAFALVNKLFPGKKGEEAIAGEMNVQASLL